MLVVPGGTQEPETKERMAALRDTHKARVDGANWPCRGVPAVSQTEKKMDIGGHLISNKNVSHRFYSTLFFRPLHERRQ